MTPERKNRLRASGRVTLRPVPSATEAITSRELDRTRAVTRVTRVTRNDDQPGKAASPSETGDVSYDPRFHQTDHWAEVEERAAIAQHDGGIPATFALAFARLQLERPTDIEAALWRRAVDAMGRLLDQSRDLAHTGDTGDTGFGYADFANEPDMRDDKRSTKLRANSIAPRYANTVDPGNLESAGSLDDHRFVVYPQ